MNLGKRSAAEFFGTFCAGVRRMRKRRTGSGLPRLRHRLCWRGAGLRPYGSHHGLRHWPHFRMRSKSCGHRGISRGQAVSGKGISSLCAGAGGWGLRGSRNFIRGRQRQSRLQPGGRVRFQRLWGTLSRRIFAHGMFRSRSRANHVFPADHHGLNRPARPAGLRSDCDRPGPDADSPGRHSRNQHVGQSGAQHRPGPVCRRMGRASALVILAGPDYRRSPGRSRIPGPVRRSGPQSRTQARARASSQDRLGQNDCVVAPRRRFPRSWELGWKAIEGPPALFILASVAFAGGRGILRLAPGLGRSLTSKFTPDLRNL